MQVKNLTHTKIKIGPFPLIEQVLEALSFRKILGKFIKHEGYIEAIEILTKSLLVEPAALYRIPQWSAQFIGQRTTSKRLGDDKIGRALDKLFLADRATLQTQLTLQAIRAYKIDTAKIHNDSTSIKFFGAYQGQSSKSVKLCRGHSKDHRPDLKQVVYNLSITDDGAVPVHFKCYDGNKTDDVLHIETWLTLRGILAKSDFLYVADSKLCTEENMRKIDQEGGRFVTIVPETRSEVSQFGLRCFESEIRWDLLTRRESTRKKGHYDVFQVAQGLFQLSEGFRVYWYRSSEKRRRDEESRQDRIECALEKLNELQSDSPRGRRTEVSMRKEVDRILVRYQASKWVDVEVRIREVEKYKKTSSGKPKSDSLYRRAVRKVPYLVVTKNLDGIARSKATDGIFPLVTNTKLNAKEVLAAYKYQPFIEKRFSWIKSDYELAPVFLKKVERIEALMFACYMSDLIAAIIQRQLRRAMERAEVEYVRTLPEERPSRTPTWEQLQRLFADHSKYELRRGDKPLKTFWDPVNQHQLQVLDLLGVPKAAYAGY